MLPDEPELPELPELPDRPDDPDEPEDPDEPDEALRPAWPLLLEPDFSPEFSLLPEPMPELPALLPELLPDDPELRSRSCDELDEACRSRSDAECPSPCDELLRSRFELPDEALLSLWPLFDEPEVFRSRSAMMKSSKAGDILRSATRSLPACLSG